MKKFLCLFERPFKIQKNGVFLFEISFFVFFVVKCKFSLSFIAWLFSSELLFSEIAISRDEEIGLPLRGRSILLSLI